MLVRARALWNHLVDGFWFIPGGVAFLYAVLAFGFIQIDRNASTRDLGFSFQADASAARDVLTTIAGSLITVAVLAFSLTIVVLTLISSQFSPRAVRNLLADKVNQIVAGSFVGIFAYCLIVLRTVRDSSPTGAEFVPALSVTLAIALALVALGLLLGFIHRTGTSIQASNIAARVAGATLKALDRLYPDPHGRTIGDVGPQLLAAWQRGEGCAVHPPRPGYIQVLSLDDVADILQGTGANVHAAPLPGDFVSEQTAVLTVWPKEAVDDDKLEALRRTIIVGEGRDLRQDAAYGLRQLADIGLKALSPGINDPTTARTCIAYLGAALERLGERSIPADVRDYPEQGVVIVASRRDFDDYVDEAYAELSRYASDNARVVVAVIEALSRIADVVSRNGALERTDILREIGLAAAEPALEQAATARDRDAIRDALARLEHALSPKGAPVQSDGLPQ